MWMQYSSQSWAKVEDIGSAIEKLSHEFYDLSMDALHAANYDLNLPCENYDEASYFINKSERYSKGSNICNKYSHGILSLEEFCQQMIHTKLKYFLYALKTYLPKEIIEKYQLQNDEEELDESEEEREIDESEDTDPTK